jgi:hypothetical protein
VAFVMSTTNELGEWAGARGHDVAGLDAAAALATSHLGWPLPASSQAAAPW